MTLSNWRIVLFVCLFAFVSADTPAYVTQSTAWPDGSIVMELQLGGLSRNLIDGSTGWGKPVEGALATWNRYLDVVAFRVVRDSNASIKGNNGKNNVFWSSSAYGKPFDDYSSPTQKNGIIALTLTWSIGSRRTESDVIFNNDVAWNSYRGKLQSSSTGGTLNDIRRVALHEFGHVLGLGHPNDRGQRVTAQMNSTESDLDTLAADDIAGAEALYSDGNGQRD